MILTERRLVAEFAPGAVPSWCKVLKGMELLGAKLQAMCLFGQKS